MRKRGKKRIPQDIKPWTRIQEANFDVLQLPAKKTSRWVAGGRRDWNTRLLTSIAAAEISKLIKTAMVRTTPTSAAQHLQFQLPLFSRAKMAALGKYKNFCLISGRGRTYNRDLLLARHNLRKLVGVGVVSGLIK